MRKILSGIALLFISTQASLFITADIDLRYRNIDFDKHTLAIEAVGLNARKIFKDSKGDRLILFAVADLMHNLSDFEIEQAYAMYKGPLGKWNISLGRLQIPFGLLPNYSTKRFLISSFKHNLPDTPTGIVSDNGLQVSGLFNNFDYAISLTQDTRTYKWLNIDNWLGVARVGYQGLDFEDIRIGISGFTGKIIEAETHNHNHKDTALHKTLFAIDVIKYYGLFVTRAELVFGKAEHKNIIGWFAVIDYALFPNTNLNIAYNYLTEKDHSVFMGLTYDLYPGLQIRAGQKMSLIGENNEFSVQLYKIFNYMR